MNWRLGTTLKWTILHWVLIDIKKWDVSITISYNEQKTLFEINLFQSILGSRILSNLNENELVIGITNISSYDNLRNRPAPPLL